MKSVTKKFNKALTLLLAFAMVITSITVTSPVTAQAAAKKKIVKSVSVAKTATVEVGKSATVKATVKATKKVAAKDLRVTAKSSDKAVATVKVAKNPAKKANKGVSQLKITGVKAGTAKITVTAKNVNKKGKAVKKTITVTVKGAAAPAPSASVAPSAAPNTVAVESIAFKQASYTVEKGKSTQAEVVITPDNATDKTVKFTSSDATVATVTDVGIIFGSSKGTATITATSSNGKTATATVTVTEPVTIELNKTSLVLGIAQTANLTATAAGVEWSSDNTKVATVDADGKVTAVAVGTANIIATASGVSASCKVQVTKHDPETVGVTLSVFNPIKNNDGAVIDNTVLINQDMVVQAYVEQNGAPLKGRRVKLVPTVIDYLHVSPYNFDIKVDGKETNVAVTDDNGIAEFTFAADNYMSVDSTYDVKADCPYASFLLQTEVDNVPNKEDITVKFGSVYRSGIVVDNNRDIELDDIIPFDGHAAGDDGIQTTFNTNDFYADEWVTSQQVGNDVYLSATPQFILPPDRKDTEAKFEIVFPSKTVTTGQKDVEVTGPGVTESYTLYNDGTDITTTTSVMNIPEGLVSMSVYFDKISISKYSQLFIDLYDYEGGVIGSKVFHWNKTEFEKTYTKEEGVQVENLDQMKGKGILIVSIQSPGQVDVSTTGYKLSRVTGDFNTNLTLLPEEIEVVNSVTWKDVTSYARYSVAKKMEYTDVIKYLPEYVGVENSYIIDDSNYTFAYRMPTFNSNAENANAVVGNALITATYTAPNGDVKNATYAYPVMRVWDSVNSISTNTNDLMKKTTDIKAIFLGYDVIDKDGNIQQTTGGIKTKGNQAIVSSTSNLKSGAIFVEARLKVDALQKEIDTADKTANFVKHPLKGANKKYPLYSYVQFVAKPEAAEADGEVPTFHAVEDQYIIVTGQVIAGNGENQTDQEVKFYYGPSKKEIKEAMIGTTIGTGVKVASVDPKTNSEGKAYLVLIGNEGAKVDDIVVEYKGGFKNLKTYAGDQEFVTIKQGDEYMNKCNLCWLDLGMAYDKEEKDNHAGVWTYAYASGATETTDSESVVDKTWKVGFLPIAKCPNGDFTVDFNALRAAAEPKNLFVGIKNVGVNYQIAGDHVDGCTKSTDITGDGTKLDVALITSSKIGTTKVNGSLRLDADSVEVQYYDADSKLQTIKTVGVNEAKLNSKPFAKNLDLGGNINYTMTWVPSNWESEYIHPYGNRVAMDQTTDIFFRLHDQNNNAIKDTAVKVTAKDDTNANFTSFTASAKTDADGLVKIHVPAPGVATIITFTVAVGTEYTDVSVPVNYVDPGTAAAPDFKDDPIIKTSTPQTVELKFNNDVNTEGLTQDILKKLFVVENYNGDYLKIANVELRVDRVLITLEDPTKGFIDNEYYKVRFAELDECVIGGVKYVLTDIYGHAFADGKTTGSFQVHMLTE